MMKLNNKNILLLVCLMMCSSFASVFFYATIINPVKKIYIEESIRARKVAEKELLFSDRVNRVFRSSSPTNFISAAERTVEGVVFIRALQKIKDQNYLTETYVANNGSGVILSSDGYIITNSHVIEDAANIEVMLNDNREYEAKLIGRDEHTDLALLKIEESDLPFLIFGNSDSLRLGEWVMAIGNPFRLQSTITAGIVSAKGRSIDVFENRGIESFIQTDAAVNPGNSGGALVNTNGELVGINTAIMTSSGNYEGFSFAVPSNLAKKVITDIKEYGAVQRGWMGVQLESVDAYRANKLGLDEVSGVYIALVNAGGAAAQAGIKSNDVIIKMDGQKINSLPSLMERLGRQRPGDKIKIEYFRDGAKKRTTVILRNQLNSTDYVAIRKDKVLLDLGFELRELDLFEKARTSTNGVKVVSVHKDSKISKSNLEPGFIITKINNLRVSKVNDIISFLDGRKGTVVLEGFYENYPGEYPYTFEME